MTKNERHQAKLTLRVELKDLAKKLDLLPDETLNFLTAELVQLKLKVNQEAIKELEKNLD